MHCARTECGQMGALKFCVMKEKLIATVFCEVPRDAPGSPILPQHQEEREGMGKEGEQEGGKRCKQAPQPCLTCHLA